MKWLLFLAATGSLCASSEIDTIRKPTHKIHEIVLNRWSPRSMTGETMKDEELFPLFEAARWAPSSRNHQPWRILYAKRDTPDWDLFFNLLVEFNKEWCKNASALVLIISQNNFEHNNAPSQTHSFDTGAAWMSMALEGSSRGYVVHGMSGFDYEKAKKDLQIPEDYTIEAMAAIGKRAPSSALPIHLQKSEAPSSRKPLEEIVYRGTFGKKTGASPETLLPKRKKSLKHH